MNQNVCFKLIQKYDGYKALIILEVILTPNIQKDYCSRFTKNIRCINPALINTHLKLVNRFKNYHYCMICSSIQTQTKIHYFYMRS